MQLEMLFRSSYFPRAIKFWCWSTNNSCYMTCFWNKRRNHLFWNTTTPCIWYRNSISNYSLWGMVSNKFALCVLIEEDSMLVVGFSKLSVDFSQTIGCISIGGNNFLISQMNRFYMTFFWGKHRDHLFWNTTTLIP